MKYTFIFAFILSSLISCKKLSKSIESDSMLNKKASIRSGNILYSEDAEGSTVFSGLTKQTYTTYGINQSDSQHYTGSKSVRFELRDTDSMNNNGTRAEVAFPATTALDRWYAFSVYFPSAFYQYDNKDEVIMQWHQGGGATPALCLRTKKDSLYLRVMGTLWLRLTGTGGIAKDYWRRYAVHVKFSSDTSTNPSLSTTGLVEILCDGGWIARYYGQNMYTVGGSYSNPIWKLGIYKSAWNDNGTSMTSKRVIYFDDIKIGDETCTEDDFYTWE